MDVLWRMRHRGTDLMGSVLNVNSGDWVRRDSGVGAGIDSYYEYCLKAYILLGKKLSVVSHTRACARNNFYVAKKTFVNYLALCVQVMKNT